jgi:MOSC N-terminal beta barrel domain
MRLYQYPIKGLSPQAVENVQLKAGQPFPFDRLFALARPGVAVTAKDPKWAKKGLFVMLMLDEGLASVRTWLDPETLLLTARQGDRLVLSANLADAAGRRDAEGFFHRLAPTLAQPNVANSVILNTPKRGAPCPPLSWAWNAGDKPIYSAYRKGDAYHALAGGAIILPDRQSDCENQRLGARIGPQPSGYSVDLPTHFPSV